MKNDALGEALLDAIARAVTSNPAFVRMLAGEICKNSELLKDAVAIVDPDRLAKEIAATLTLDEWRKRSSYAATSYAALIREAQTIASMKIAARMSEEVKTI